MLYAIALALAPLTVLIWNQLFLTIKWSDAAFRRLSAYVHKRRYTQDIFILIFSKRMLKFEDSVTKSVSGKIVLQNKKIQLDNRV